MQACSCHTHFRGSPQIRLEGLQSGRGACRAQHSHKSGRCCARVPLPRQWLSWQPAEVWAAQASGEGEDLCAPDSGLELTFCLPAEGWARPVRAEPSDPTQTVTVGQPPARWDSHLHPLKHRLQGQGWQTCRGPCRHQSDALPVPMLRSCR